ncbi:hypothetical protein cyc_08066 [Cyclospora cayetanensis]|uniref:Uncharacterized protein n=1 Tax=Cyclospora cayetanensis TaxID=88456 RepID=A0A1D3D411_9EIME|nr:hypothetical protein cyc_08066 [Cyclospora cayetanensis]
MCQSFALAGSVLLHSPSPEGPSPGVFSCPAVWRSAPMSESLQLRSKGEKQWQTPQESPLQMEVLFGAVKSRRSVLLRRLQQQAQLQKSPSQQFSPIQQRLQEGGLSKTIPLRRPSADPMGAPRGDSPFSPWKSSNGNESSLARWLIMQPKRWTQVLTRDSVALVPSSTRRVALLLAGLPPHLCSTEAVIAVVSRAGVELPRSFVMLQHSRLGRFEGFYRLTEDLQRLAKEGNKSLSRVVTLQPLPSDWRAEDVQRLLKTSFEVFVDLKNIVFAYGRRGEQQSLCFCCCNSDSDALKLLQQVQEVAVPNHPAYPDLFGCSFLYASTAEKPSPFLVPLLHPPSLYPPLLATAKSSCRVGLLHAFMPLSAQTFHGASGRGSEGGGGDLWLVASLALSTSERGFLTTAEDLAWEVGVLVACTSKGSMLCASAALVKVFTYGWEKDVTEEEFRGLLRQLRIFPSGIVRLHMEGWEESGFFLQFDRMRDVKLVMVDIHFEDEQIYADEDEAADSDLDEPIDY